MVTIFVTAFLELYVIIKNLSCVLLFVNCSALASVGVDTFTLSFPSFQCHF